MKPATVMTTPSGRRGYSAVGDQYGLLGLQQTILSGAAPSANVAPPTADGAHHHPPPQATAAAAGDQANMTCIVRGFDLNALGLPLSQTEPLHPTFSSPWSDAPQKIQPDFRLPQCYFVQPPHLKFAMFQKFQDDTLFYIFYSMPKDVLQLAAARELQNREWRFHKDLKQWVMRTPGTEQGAVKSQTFERGSFTFFCVEKWAKERRDDFTLVYTDLEEIEAPAAGAVAQPPNGAVAAAQPAAGVH